MEYIGLTADEQDDVFYYFLITQGLRELQVDHSVFFAMLKPSLITRIQHNVFERNL